MLPRSARGGRFTPRPLPGGDPHAFLTMRFRGAVAGEEWPCRGSVVLALPIEAVLPFATDGVVEAVDAQRTRVSAGSWSWSALAAAFLRFDAEVTAPEPAALATAFATLAGRAASASD
jgi:hypothetical protein